MNVPHLSLRAAPALLAAAIACAATSPAGAAAASEAAAATDSVSVRVIVVQASGSPGADGPLVDESLAAIPAPWARLGFHRFVRERLVERRQRWNERLTVDYADGGSYRLTPLAAKADRKATLHVEQRLPGDEKPCLAHEVPVGAGWHVPFCSVDLDGTTWIFLVAASARD